MTKTMTFKLIDRLFIVVYGAEEVTDEEWTSYLEVVESHGIDRTTQLIFTDGGGPNAAQCMYLNNLLAGRSPPVAVVSASAEIRGVVTALSWFNRKIRAFSPSGLREAIAYLQIPPDRLGLIEREAAKLRRSLSDHDGETGRRPCFAGGGMKQG